MGKPMRQKIYPVTISGFWYSRLKWPFLKILESCEGSFEKFLKKIPPKKGMNNGGYIHSGNNKKL